MMSMGLGRVLTTIRDQVLPANHEVTHLGNGVRETKALTFSLDCSYGLKNRFGLHIMFFGNTSVFYLVTKSPFDKPNWTKAINATNHDSCWRSMEFLSNIYFDACKKAEPDARTCDVHELVTFSLFNKPWTIGTVQWTMDKNDKSNYKRCIVSFKGN